MAGRGQFCGGQGCSGQGCSGQVCSGQLSGLRRRAAAILIGLAGLGLGGGCAVPQSEVCAVYTECVAHVDQVFDLPPTNTSAYEENGSCWKDVDAATRCNIACAQANVDLRRAIDLANADRGPCG